MDTVLGILLNIILTILKIIGIGLILLIIIVLIILFSKIKIKVVTNNEKDFKYFVKVTYILGLFSYILDSENNINCLKIFGINIEKYKKLRKTKKISKNKKNIDVDRKNDNIDEIDDREIIIESIVEPMKDDYEIDKDHKIDEENKNYDKKFKIKETINKLKYIFNYPNKQEIFNLTFLLIKRLIKAIKIKKIKINIDYGLDEPYKTGNFCGIISVITSFLPKKHIKNINIMPDFEKEVFLVDCIVKGKTSLIKILLPIIVFIIKEPIRKIIFNKGE